MKLSGFRFYGMATGMLALCLLLCMLLPQGHTAAAEDGRGYVHVAIGGSDAADGTENAPLATLQAAQNKVRSMKESGLYPNGITVLVHGGTYSISQPLVLTDEDSGTEDCPITWRNYANDEVTYTAGIVVPGEQFEKVTDPAVLNRIAEESSRDDLYVLDLASCGVEDVGDVYLFGSYGYSASVTDLGLVTRPQAPAMEIFYNNIPMTSARYPNEGYMTIATVNEVGWDYDDPDRVPQGTPFTITVDDDRMTHWTTAPQDSIMMYGYWKWEWADQTIPLHSMDVSNRSLTSKWHSVFGVLPGKPFYVHNLLEELDTPGEYYIDRENNRLYINPPTSLANSTVTLTVMEDTPFQLRGADYVTFRGINVNGTRNSAYYIAGGEHNAIVDCEISHTAKTAVVIYGAHNGVSDCYIHDVDGGVSLNDGDIGTLQYAENYAENNHIERFSRLTRTYMPAISINGVGNRAVHNEMNDAPHLAISYSGQCNQIMYNEIYDVLQETDDAGAIYGGLSWHDRGHAIQYNYIHDCRAVGSGWGGGIWAVYADGGQCEIEVYGNVIANFAGDAVLINGGWHNVVQNNYFINTEHGVDVSAIMKNNIDGFYKHHYPRLETVKETIMNSRAWKERFPTFFSMMAVPDSVKAVPRGNLVSGNLYYKQQYAPVTARSYNNAAIEQNVPLSVDPGFVDETNGNYNLRADSPLYNLIPGFEALPFEQMGRSITKSKMSPASIGGGFHLTFFGDGTIHHRNVE